MVGKCGICGKENCWTDMLAIEYQIAAVKQICETCRARLQRCHDRITTRQTLELQQEIREEILAELARAAGKLSKPHRTEVPFRPWLTPAGAAWICMLFGILSVALCWILKAGGTP